MLNAMSFLEGDWRTPLLRAYSAFKNAKSPEDRELAVRAMGTFDDPVTLRRAFDVALTDELRLSDLTYLFGSALGHRTARPVLYRWEKENWEKLRARIPMSSRWILVGVASSMCTTSERDDAKAFLVSGTHDLEGTKRELEEGLEEAQLCIALRDHGAAEVSRYLRKK